MKYELITMIIGFIGVVVMIWQSNQQINSRIDMVINRLDITNQRLDTTNTRIDKLYELQSGTNYKRDAA